MTTLVNPLDERAEASGVPAPRLERLEGSTLALLDISKPGGSHFLDRMAELLVSRYGVARIVRETKPTYTKPAPPALVGKLGFVDGVIEALAD
ncbi:MAG: hypothetical protein FJ207_03225 [Gemmatimonadetes bacterium]|nr:hypothetical protein [Gemmatimonadota bacterium]